MGKKFSKAVLLFSTNEAMKENYKVNFTAHLREIFENKEGKILHDSIIVSSKLLSTTIFFICCLYERTPV